MDTEIKILRQGAVRVNNATIQKEGNGVVAIGIDMKSKWVEIDCTSNNDNGNPTILIGANEDTIGLSYSVANDQPTEISLPAYKGWKIWSINTSRYTIYLCLIK